eukprot:767257-Hanusia_phi.AAC.5
MLSSKHDGRDGEVSKILDKSKEVLDKCIYLPHFATSRPLPHRILRQFSPHIPNATYDDTTRKNQEFMQRTLDKNTQTSIYHNLLLFIRFAKHAMGKAAMQELERELLKNSTMFDLPKVLVGRLCGEAVMQGAQVFAPGIAAAPYSLSEGDILAVYGELEEEEEEDEDIGSGYLRYKQRTRQMLFNEEESQLVLSVIFLCEICEILSAFEGKQPRDTDVVVDGSNSVFLGLGRARMNRWRWRWRNGIFGKDPKGIAVEMTMRIWDSPSLSGWRNESGGEEAGELNMAAGWRDDVCMLQSFPAAFTSLLLQPESGERVLDMCAAPGGKSTHIAQLMKDSGEVVSCDRSSSKVAKIEQLAMRFHDDVNVHDDL